MLCRKLPPIPPTGEGQTSLSGTPVQLELSRLEQMGGIALVREYGEFLIGDLFFVVLDGFALEKNPEFLFWQLNRSCFRGFCPEKRNTEVVYGNLKGISLCFYHSYIIELKKTTSNVTFQIAEFSMSCCLCCVRKYFLF